MPEGMWLAEAAVDSQSLDIMAELGLKYTILAPHQAKRVKKISEDRAWLPEDEEHIDLKRPYLCKLPSGRTINIFFYDGGVSQAIAFEGLLHNGEVLAKRIVDAFDKKSAVNQIVHLATDGESYGHHHKFGDMALSYALKHIQELETIVLEGKYKCFLLFIVQRTDVSSFQTSVIDPIYKEAVLKASNNGVKIIVLQVDWNKEDGKAYFYSNNLRIIL